MMGQIDAWVAPAAKQKLVRERIDLGPLGDEEVEVRVEYCGLCHSDLSMLNDDWGWSRFPAVLGHEAVGSVVEVGRAAKGIQVG
jgi:alcohol/geraniol dehydrogenase (NADP+)